MRKIQFLVFGFFLAMAPFATQAAEVGYAGEVTLATGAFEALTPVGTPVGGPIAVDGAALAAGTVGIADIVSIEVNVGGFCFATGTLTCGDVGALVPITSIDTAAITGTTGTLGGSFSVTAFSPTFMVAIPIAFDLDAGTFFADGDALGTVEGTGLLTNPTTGIDYTGEVTLATGAFEALTPVGTVVGGPLVVWQSALEAGAIGIPEIVSIEVNVGGFCFATGTLTCGDVGAIVPITSIDTAAITGTTGTLGGSFSVSAFSPTFMVSIPIAFDLDAGTFFADGDALGTVGGTGTLTVPDMDADAIPDFSDNCTLVANADQRDTNGDGYGNICDPDFDNNGVVNFLDISGWVPFFNTACGDVDQDLNGDGGCNFGDYAIIPGYFGSPPGPSGIAP